MSKPRRTRQAIVIRRATRTRSLPSSTAATATIVAASSGGASVVSQSTLDAARRIGESVIVAAVTSAGLYLVGSVYTDSFYRRLSIEPVSFSLSPPVFPPQSTQSMRVPLQFSSPPLLVY